MRYNSPSLGKSGFGLLESLVSMFVLALMFTAVCMVNISNHNAALRIATRNQATQIGQRVIDSLQSVGLSQVVDSTFTIRGDTLMTVGPAFSYAYTCRVLVTPDTSVQGVNGSPINIVRAKKIVLNVDWTLNGHTNTINLNSVVQ